LKELNPELSKEVTPPRYPGGYLLRIPSATTEVFAANYEKIPAKKELVSDKLIRHKVKKGETLSSIAQKYKVSSSDIALANNLGNSYRIIAGTYLLVPQIVWKEKKSKEKKASEEKNQVLVKSENQEKKIPIGLVKEENSDTKLPLSGLNKSNNSNTQDNGSSITELTGRLIIHVIKRGESLWKIARLYGVSVTKILIWNNISNPHEVKAGSKIKIYY
jgi:membrane-bound lytic murein transglycosylase D